MQKKTRLEEHCINHSQASLLVIPVIAVYDTRHRSKIQERPSLNDSTYFIVKLLKESSILKRNAPK